uniref:ADP-ribosyl cyclase/cyclic ADP-ribose hydrolase n=1 Tax=Arabidopsis thaliana TaxID=3702 RepID=O23532_ARATH|nr:disease resistance RPP5 like protein [Arabidopsis thaliana]
MAAASSSCSRRYDVFPSFSGVDVRKTFLSNLLEAFDRRSINTFMDHGIERSRTIAPELISAIREARISIVIFSKNYASSTWCLDELVEIHNRLNDWGQLVISVFYDVDPSEVRKQTGEFGDVFKKTCEDKEEDQKQRWMQALVDITNIAGEDLRNGPSEAAMVVKIANDVSNKLISPSNSFGDFVGIEAHLEAMNSILCLESKEARMVGIWGPSGIGKSTIGKALYSQLFCQFHFHAFVPHVYSMKSEWEEIFLSKILGKDIKIGGKLGVVEQMLNQKKVLIVLDDVDDPEFLKTLVGETKWFGPGSRIIVITQDMQLLKAHDIDLLYEVKFPSLDLALKMLCRSAFGENSPPDDFKALAFEVAVLAGNLPLGLSVLGSSLKRRTKEEWMEMMPRFRNGLNGDIMKTLRVSYDRLHQKDQDMFLYIACLFNGFEVSYVNDLLEDNVGVTMLVEKSLIRITPDGDIEMHNLLEKLGIEIDRAKSKGNPGKRRFLTDFEDTLRKTVLGIRFCTAFRSKELLPIDEKSFQGMRNLQCLSVTGDYMDLPQSLVYLPPKLRLLDWDRCPLKCLPYSFKADYLIQLTMMGSKLEKLWEGTVPLGSLKRMNMHGSRYLREISDLSNARNLEELNLSECRSLVTLSSSIQNAIKLIYLDMRGCTKLESFPTHLNLESLEYLGLLYYDNLRNFPVFKMETSTTSPHGIEIRVENCIWNKNLPGLDYLACLVRCMPCEFRPNDLVRLIVRGNQMLEKLWEGVQSLASLVEMDMSECGNLTEIPDLSKATNLVNLYLSNCKSLVTVPSTIGNLQKLVRLEMKECTGLEVLPTDVNLSSLKMLDLSGCSSLRTFPLISKSIKWLYLENTAIEEVPCCIENFSWLTVLMMYCCKRLKNISPNIFRLTILKLVDFTECRGVNVAMSDASVEDHSSYIPLYENIEYTRHHLPSKLTFNDVEFNFSCSKRIKECGIRLLNMTSGTSEEYINLPCVQIVADTSLTALNMELSLGQGEASSVSSYPSLEGESLCVDSMISEQQDEEIPILNSGSGN